jgi:carotenoid cleavage dioxygenase-like enzyme
MKLFNLFNVIYFVCLKLSSSFLNFNFGPKFEIIKNEITSEIKYNIPFFKKQTVKKISGFYGLIGPDINTKHVNDIFNDLFNKNGIIQGVFFDKGKIHFIKYYVRTEKLKYEEVNGIIPMNPLNFILFKLLENINFLPNIFGLANTALMTFKNKTYALNDRDYPYEINIDFKNKKIETLNQVKIPFCTNLLAHSKITNNSIESLDFSSIIPTVKYLHINDTFDKVNEININIKYISMIHDFVSLNNTILFLDTPMVIDFFEFSKSPIPFKFRKENQCQFCLINKTNGNVNYINIDSIYILHYANAYETENEIIIYACIYDEFDFTKPNENHCKFRKIIINKNNFTTIIEKNNELEKFNVEFPIQYKNYTIMTNTENLKIINLIVVNNFNLHKIININKYIYGEPSIIEIENEPYLIAFSYDSNNKNYLTLYGIENDEEISINIPYNISIGFHSMFVKPI